MSYLGSQGSPQNSTFNTTQLSQAPWMNQDAHLYQPPTFPQPAPAQPQPPPPQQPSAMAAGPPPMDRRRAFLFGLANVMAGKGTPLPPSFTGVPAEGYDPNTSMWRNIDMADELGSFRLAGKTVDLFTVWMHVQAAGGSQNLNKNEGMGWNAILQRLEVPTEWPPGQTHPSGRSVANLLSLYHNTLLGTFETLLLHQKKLQLEAQAAQSSASGQGPPPQDSLIQQPHSILQPNPPQMQTQQGAQPQGVNPQALLDNQNRMLRGSSAPSHSPVQQPWTPAQSTWNQNLTHSPLPGNTIPSSLNGPRPLNPPAPRPPINQNGSNGNSSDVNGLKRKSDSEEVDVKRARLSNGETYHSNILQPIKISLLEPSNIPSINAVGPVPDLNAIDVKPTTSNVPSRRKIEYVPLAREVDTFGGRNLDGIEAEWAAHRPLRDVNSWGTIHTDALTLSLRSRLATELAYALTTLTMVSTMKGPEAGSGFPIFQCPDLMEELLDLLEDTAFGEAVDSDQTSKLEDSRIITHRYIVDYVQDRDSDIFAALESPQGSKDPSLGPKQRPGAIVIVITNILRNLALPGQNLLEMSRQFRMFDLLLRLTEVVQDADGTLRAVSPVLSLSDILVVRRDTLHLLSLLASGITFKAIQLPTKSVTRLVARIFDLAASFLTDPNEAVAPALSVKRAGLGAEGFYKPPYLADLALEVFTRIGQPDSNREAFAQAVPQSSLWTLFEALVHRLPVGEPDYQLFAREPWMSYLEKNIMAIYALGFLSPPQVKRRMKEDPHLRFPALMLRMITRFLAGHERAAFGFSAKRAIEALKVIDDEEDPFATHDDTTTVLSFGMGYGEANETSTEKGTGMLAGKARATGFEFLMMARDVQSDGSLFGELDSLLRLDV